MKLLQSGNLEALGGMLSNLEIGDWRVEGRLESYSCKVAGAEQKTLYKKMAREGQPSEIVALSPPTQSYLSKSAESSEGDMELNSENLQMFVISRKMLFNLITTLNLSFQPDYDFSDAKSHEFCRAPSLAHVWSEIDSRLGQAPLYSKAIRQLLWEGLDAEIGGMRNCEIYIYKPDLTSDPFSESGCVWSFNFFFYNVKLKRIIFFSCKACSPNSSASEIDDEFMMDDED